MRNNRSNTNRATKHKNHTKSPGTDGTNTLFTKSKNYKLVHKIKQAKGGNQKKHRT